MNDVRHRRAKLADVESAVGASRRARRRRSSSLESFHDTLSPKILCRGTVDGESAGEILAVFVLGFFSSGETADDRRRRGFLLFLLDYITSVLLTSSREKTASPV